MHENCNTEKCAHIMTNANAAHYFGFHEKFPYLLAMHIKIEWSLHPTQPLPKVEGDIIIIILMMYRFNGLKERHNRFVLKWCLLTVKSFIM